MTRTENKAQPRLRSLQQIRKCIDIVEQAEQRTQEQTHQTAHRPQKGVDISLCTYTQEQIDRANQADLVSFLQAQGEQLDPRRTGIPLETARQLDGPGKQMVSGTARAKAARPIDFVMEFFGKSFT